MLRERAYRKQEIASAATTSNIHEKELKYQLTSNNDFELWVLQRLDVEEPLDGLHEYVEGGGVQETGDSKCSNHLQHPRERIEVSTDLQQ
jgi:hypothetical protein